MTEPVLVIGNKNYSSWSLRAWLVLVRTGIDFEEVRVPLYVTGYKQALLRYSPAGKVPVYIENGRTVWDSLAICEYLAETHPSLWPADPEARAAARSVSAEMHAGFSALRNALPMNCRARRRRIATSAAIDRDVARIIDIWTTCRNRYDDNGPWLFGQFCIADAMFAPVASRFMTYGIALDGPAAGYRQTVLSDPAMQRWYADSAREPEVIAGSEIG